MQHSLRGALAVGCIVLAAFIAAPAAAVPITFVKLAGLTGGSPAHTAIYRADLSSISFDILSISISDNSFGIGGANGKFSGFDLDAIKLSSTFATSASDAAALMGLGVFDFSAAGALFTPARPTCAGGPEAVRHERGGHRR
ncbi:MAG: hypothetical protein MUD16_14255 [Desulfobacterales bacterium]|jgi:hypothetical protein|nr:hypothetical protein [Desulfobacterales bacterium]